MYIPQDGHWLASFEVIPPPQKKVGFSVAKKNELNSPLKTAFSDPKSWRFYFFVLFSEKNCHAVLDSREHQGLLPD